MSGSNQVIYDEVNKNFIVPEDTMGDIVEFINELYGTLSGEATTESWPPRVDWHRLPHIPTPRPPGHGVTWERDYCCELYKENTGEILNKRGYREMFRFRAADKCQQWRFDLYNTDQNIQYRIVEKHCE